MRFVGECRPLFGGSAMESSGGCGALAARTDEEGNFLWREAGKSVGKDGSGADFCCHLFLMEEYFFCFWERNGECVLSWKEKLSNGNRGKVA